MSAHALLLTLLLNAGPNGGEDLVVERVQGSDPARVSVRCLAANARTILHRIADVMEVDASAIPEEMNVMVGPVTIREASADDVIEIIAGAAGYVGQVEHGRIVCEAFPKSTQENAREAIRREAIVQFGRFLSRGLDDPRAPRAWLELAALHEEAGEMARAIEVLRVMRESVSEGADQLSATVNLGRLEFLTGAIDNAIETLTAIAEKSPNSPEAAQAYYLLGRCRLATNDPQLAIRYFSIAQERFPDSDSALSARIWSIEALRATGDAEDAWSEIGKLELFPLSISNALDLLEVRTVAADASADFAEASEGWLALAAVAKDEKSRLERLARAARATRLQGDPVATLLVELAASPEKKSEILSNWCISVGATEVALKYREFDPELRLRAAIEFIARGETARALKLLEQAPDDAKWRGARRLIEADAALESHNPGRVPNLLRSVIRESKDEIFVREGMRRLGEAYLALGDLINAELVFQGVIPEEEKQ